LRSAPTQVLGFGTSVHRELNEAMGLRFAHTSAEQIGIATEVLDWRERDRIDALLDRHVTGPRELAMRWASDVTNSSSSVAGNARLIQPYRSARSAS
jgi:hypothetical protein